MASVSVVMPNAPAVQAATSTTTGLMVPLYTYPTSSTWDTMASVKNSYPSVSTIAIINPSNGPGGSKDSNYANGIQKLQSAGISVLGYVATGYTQRSLSVVKADIDTYNSWYPSINGIFFDEMANWKGGESYYKSANDHAKSKGFSYTVGNPGADTISSYVGTVDNIIIYETAGLPSLSSLGGWHTNYDKSNFSIIPYAVSSHDETYVSGASSYVGYIYITNDSLPNPWDSLPPYYRDLAATVGGISGSLTTTKYSLKINSVDQKGNSINGMWIEIKKSGTPVITGFSPLTVSLEAATYEVSAANYQQITFEHWSDGSKSSTTSLSLTTDKSLTAHYVNGDLVVPQYAQVNVKTVDMKGNEIKGLRTSVSQNGKTILTGFSPLSFTATVSSTYSVTVADYQNYVFDHWHTGSTSRTMTIAPTADTTLIAYYNTGPKEAALTVRSVDLNGKSITGMWVEIKKDGATIKTGFTPLTYTVTSGTQYTIAVGDYKNIVFDHWENGSTNRYRTITAPDVGFSITAYYKQ